MSDDKIELHREDLKIEDDRNLYNYTFTDSAGEVLEPEPTLPMPPPSPGDKRPTHNAADKAKTDAGGNLNDLGDDRKG